MEMTNASTAALNKFKKKLKAGMYETYSKARSALGGYSSVLSDEDKNEARAVLEQHFKENEDEKTAPVPPIEEVEGAYLNRFHKVLADMRQMRTSVAKFVVKAAGEERHTEQALATLLSAAVEVDAFDAFGVLVRTVPSQITKFVLELGGVLTRMAQSERFFTYVGVLFAAEPSEDAVRLLMRETASEIERRHSDVVQVSAFEYLVTGKLEHAFENHEQMEVLTPLIVEYASTNFVLSWLKRHDSDLGTKRAATRFMTAYLNGEEGITTLLALVEELKPPRVVLEELVRGVLVKRQLGDALLIAETAPEDYKAQLHQILHPVVVRHGDPLAIVAFGSIFPTLVDRDELKELVMKHVDPDIDERLDDLLNGIDPHDIFESAPSVMSPKGATLMRDDLRKKLGLRQSEPKAMKVSLSSLEEMFGSPPRRS